MPSLFFQLTREDGKMHLLSQGWLICSMVASLAVLLKGEALESSIHICHSHALSAITATNRQRWPCIQS